MVYSLSSLLNDLSRQQLDFYLNLRSNLNAIIRYLATMVGGPKSRGIKEGLKGGLKRQIVDGTVSTRNML